MEIDQALLIHSKLAHALLPFWNGMPEIQRIVCSQLDEWETLDSNDQLLAQIADNLRANGVSNHKLFDSIEHAQDVPADEYLGEMFQKALTRATQLYNRYGLWTGGAAELDDFPSQNSPYPDEAPLGSFGVSGNTVPGARDRDACVSLLRVPQLLGPPSWASIPYVLCHEILCHASQAAPSSDVTDPFTEGWMDELATSVHARSVATLFPWQSQLAAEEGQRLSVTLRTFRRELRGIDMKARSARSLGFLAASIVREVLADLRELSPGTSGRRLFERLSVELNAVDAASPDEYLLGLHRSFVNNVVEGKWDLAARARRDAVLHKWVIGQLTAAEVMRFT